LALWLLQAFSHLGSSINTYCRVSCIVKLVSLLTLTYLSLQAIVWKLFYFINNCEEAVNS
jgi:hypothetical protein